MNILITGCTGFIGSNILNKFKNNNKIFVILRNKKKNEIFNHKNIKKIFYNDYNNLCKKLSKIKVDLVIHAATHYAKEHNVKDLEKFTNSNILLGNIILENVINMKVKKFINFSTIWEDYYGIKDNYFNLYSAYKKAFSKILNFYKKKNSSIKFYELMISDTFGENDKRRKIINVLKENYKNNKVTKIISRKLFINLLNVEDVVNAVFLISMNDIKSGKYLLKNKINFNMFKLVKQFNKKNKKKLKVKWMNNYKVDDKSLSYNKLKSWKPIKSNVKDVIRNIKD